MTKKHLPPPTQYSNAKSVQRNADANAGGKPGHKPPPTLYSSAMSVQRNADANAGGKPGHKPPPTLYSGTTTVQSKALQPKTPTTTHAHQPPPTRFGPDATAQPKTVSVVTSQQKTPSATTYGLVSPASAQWAFGINSGAIQKMKSASDDENDSDDGRKVPGTRKTTIKKDDFEYKTKSGRKRKKNSKYGDDFLEDQVYDNEIKSAFFGLNNIDENDPENQDIVDQWEAENYYTTDAGDYAYIPPGSNEVYPYSRPQWRPNTWGDIANTQKIGSILYCALCGKEIKVDKDNKETWVSKGGRVHKTRPPIDHDKPDWVERMRQIKGKYEGNTTVSTLTIRGEIEDSFHAPKLQIAHMMCNSAKQKAPH